MRMNARQMQLELRTKKLGRALLTTDICRSTNTVAVQLARTGASEGLTVVSEEQIEGRGRRERRWLSPRGGIWMSVVLRPLNTEANWASMPLVGALAAAQAINEVHHVNAMVRWPNDVVVGDRKLAGTLAEAKFTGRTPAYVVLGLGINCNFPPRALGELRQRVTTLSEVVGHAINREEVLSHILLKLEDLYEEISMHRDSKVMESLMRLDSSSGRRLTIQLEEEDVSGLFETYLTLTKVQILDDHNRMRQVEASVANLVEYEPEKNR